MEKHHEILLGALIGLARVTDGNEHLITPSSTALIRDCLRAVAGGDGEISSLIARIDAEKRRMVPDCFLCASPCGRTDAYDFAALLDELPEIQGRKMSLLNALCRNSQTAGEGLLYSALNVIGIAEYPAEALDDLISGLNQ